MINEFLPGFVTNMDGMPVVPAPSTSRRTQIKRAFEKADTLFLQGYESFLSTYGTLRKDFTACDVTEAYVKKCGTISPSQKKALGGLYQRLIRAGTIEKTGEYRERNQGNVAAVYRLKK